MFSGVVPAATALAASWLLGRWLPAGLATRYRFSVAFALGVIVGVAIGADRKTFIPAEFWDWVPYLGLLAAIVAGSAEAHRVSFVARALMVAVVALLAAWLLVPTWEDLAPPRFVHVATVAAGIGLLAIVLEPLPKRLPGGAFPFWLMLAAGTVAVLILAEVSETFGRLAAFPASALAGCILTAWFTRDAANWRSLALPYAVVVGGYAYTGAIYPSPPVVPLMFAPFAPLALWVCCLDPLSRLMGARAILAQAVCVLVPLLTVAAILLARSSGEAW